MQLTPYAKRWIAKSMYHKGMAFIRAAALLSQGTGNEYVVLHLVCQGIEIILKSILLNVDYDRYKSKLRRIGHNLTLAADEVAEATGFAPLKAALRSELEVLNRLYSRHLLRYGSSHDILVNAATIPFHRVMRRTFALMRLLGRAGLFKETTD